VLYVVNIHHVIKIRQL